MQPTPIPAAGRQVIDSYGPGRFRVSGVVFEGSVIVLPDQTLLWPVAELVAIDIASLAPVFEALPPVDLLLLGCGARMAPLPPALRQHVRRAGIGLEPMDTGAACRTYNVLLSDERRVAAALIAV